MHFQKVNTQAQPLGVFHRLKQAVQSRAWVCVHTALTSSVSLDCYITVGLNISRILTGHSAVSTVSCCLYVIYKLQNHIRQASFFFCLSFIVNLVISLPRVSQIRDTFSCLVNKMYVFRVQTPLLHSSVISTCRMCSFERLSYSSAFPNSLK